jgi:hypothetical protein
LERQNALTKALAVVGTVLVWFPVLAPILLSLILLAAERRVWLDYLRPAELFLLALAGSGLLLWAALRANSRVEIVLGGMSITTFTVFAWMWFGWMEGAAIAVVVALYSLGLLLVGAGGALLLRELFKKQVESLDGRSG